MAVGSQEWSGLTLAGGRYHISAKLGEGGMGFVYRALDQNIDSEVVIKVPRQAMMDDPEFASRFTREIRSLVRLSHPHIVKVTDVGTFDGIPFAVMQFLAGGSLEDQRPSAPDGQPLPCDPRSLPRWLTAVAQALDYIHTQGYVHRDVKPGNILFDSLGHAFLSDFGVAKVLASATNTAPSHTAMTGAGMVLGTPEYMAPELIMGEPFDGRADQYALAITVYEMLCGRRPFEDETKTKVLVLHTSKPPSPLTAWCPALPLRLSQAVLKGLAKEPGDRYPTCVELAKAVAAVAETSIAQDERIRLKCSACGKTGSIPVADLARLKAGGGRATCPACKSPIDIGNAVHVAPGPITGGTMKFSVPASSEPGQPSGQGPQGTGTAGFVSLGGSSGGQTPPATQQPARGGTMALSASDRQMPPPLPVKNNPPTRAGSGTLIERTLPRPDQATAARAGSGTLIERTLPRPDQATATDAFKGVIASETVGPGSRKSVEVDGSRKPAKDQTRLWIAVGAAAASAALITGVAFAVFLSPSRKDKDSASGTLTAASQAPQTTKPEIAQNSPAPVATAESLATKADTSRPVAGSTDSANEEQANRDVSAPPITPRELAATDHPITKKAGRSPTRKKANSASSGSQRPSVSGMFASGAFDIARVAQRARQLDYPMEKILATAQAYRNEIVIPAGMYCLTRARADHQAGQREFVVTECSLKERGPKKTLHMVSVWSAQMEFEPGLAAELDRHWRNLEGRVAILKLWTNNSGKSGIVAAEILQKFNPRLKPGFGPGQADIDYEVLFVNPDGSKPAKAEDSDWQRVGRLNQLYLHHKHLVAAYRRKLQTADMAGLQNQMNNLYAAMMKGMAAEAKQERALERGITGK